MDKVYYKIDENRLFQLLAEEVHLDALLSGGVDNWGDYGDAIHYFIQDYLKEHPDFFEPDEDPELFDITFQDIAAYELLDMEKIIEQEDE